MIICTFKLASSQDSYSLGLRCVFSNCSTKQHFINHPWPIWLCWFYSERRIHFCLINSGMIKQSVKSLTICTFKLASSQDSYLLGLRRVFSNCSTKQHFINHPWPIWLCWFYSERRIHFCLINSGMIKQSAIICDVINFGTL